MTKDHIHWGPLVAGMLTTLATVVLLGFVGTGNFPLEYEEYGFALIVVGACIAAWLISRIIMQHYERLVDHLPRMLRFGAVGLMTTFIDLGILNALLFIFATNVTYQQLFPFFATISFVAATLNSYLWNRHWTFKAGDHTTKKTLPSFYLVTIISFLINVGISWFLVWLHPFPVLGATLWVNISKLVATSISLVVNFLGYQNIVFRKR